MRNSNSKENKIENTMKHASPEIQSYFKKYFSKIPLDIFKSLQYVEIDKKHIVVREHDKVDYIYILLEGIIKATDQRIYDQEYVFMTFEPMSVLGSMEILWDVDTYQATLTTETTCKILVLPKNKYEFWMKNDIEMLSLEVKTMGQYVLKQVKKERMFQFLTAIERLNIIFIQYYKKNQKNGNCCIKKTRKEMAENIGVSIKTVNRSIKELEKKGEVAVDKGKLYMEQKQWEMMKKKAEKIIDMADV